jgi:hypothetical protein
MRQIVLIFLLDNGVMFGTHWSRITCGDELPDPTFASRIDQGT